MPHCPYWNRTKASKRSLADAKDLSSFRLCDIISQREIVQQLDTIQKLIWYTWNVTFFSNAHFDLIGIPETISNNFSVPISELDARQLY